MRFNLLNFDRIIDRDSVITVSDMVIKEKVNKADTTVLAPGGIFCEKIFGKSMGDSVEYSCSCGTTRGKFSLGVICPEQDCGTPVIKKESIVKKKGWIDLGDYGIINPLLFKFTEKIIGPQNFKKIISSEHTLDMDGNVLLPEDDKTTKKLKDLNILNIGIRAFCENFLEIIELFVTDGNRDAYNFILANSDKYVIYSLPVISQRLRPALILGNEFKFDKINNLYIRIIACSNSLKEEYSNSSIVVDPIVSSIQNFVNQLHDKLIEAIGGKTGWMRNNLMSNRVNFSSRTVISPLPVNSALDEIHIPYLTAVELLKFHLIRLLLPLYHYSYNKALSVWKKATLQFDQEIYDLINLILMKEKGGLRMLINRNPTISFGSILNMRVGKVKSDFSDLTMSIPNNILRLIAGDYDGCWGL